MFFNFGSHSILLYFLSSVIMALLILPVIQYFSCLVAYRLGDDSPEMKERLTLNPKAHIDPIGTLCLIFFRIGWAKPLPINPANFYRVKDRRTGMLLVALAGPGGSLVASFVCVFLANFLSLFSFAATSNFVLFSITLLQLTAHISANIALFLCLPLPGLSGQEIGEYFFPNLMEKIYSYKHYIYLFLFFLLVFPSPLLQPLTLLSNFIVNLFDKFSIFVLSLFSRIFSVF